MIFELLHKHPFATIPSQCFVADGPGVYEGLREKIKVLKRSGEEANNDIVDGKMCVPPPFRKGSSSSSSSCWREPEHQRSLVGRKLLHPWEVEALLAEAVTAT